jgi:1-aminocyclopropane-1-carboxylate deaminase/D-cysteine desulfhydrase-like pyridoxal-dependent ACC family enzyme
MAITVNSVQSLFQENTPIETYEIKGRLIHVKREDMFGIYPAPPLSKLRGAYRVLKRLYDQNVRLVGCWDTRISKLGQGVAAICAQLPGMQCIISYPTKRGVEEPPQIKVAAALGAQIFPTSGARISICYSRVKKVVEERGGVMLPFGLECPEAVDAVSREAKTVPPQYVAGGTVVLCCGSGVTLTGLLLGFQVRPQKFVGVSAGRSLRKIRACVERYVSRMPAILELHEATIPYGKVLSYPCPFPTNPNYDIKAWKLLVERLSNYSCPILFWNIGG